MRQRTLWQARRKNILAGGISKEMLRKPERGLRLGSRRPCPRRGPQYGYPREEIGNERHCQTDEVLDPKLFRKVYWKCGVG